MKIPDFANVPALIAIALIGDRRLTFPHKTIDYSIGFTVPEIEEILTAQKTELKNRRPTRM